MTTEIIAHTQPARLTLSGCNVCLHPDTKSVVYTPIPLNPDFVFCPCVTRVLPCRAGPVNDIRSDGGGKREHVERSFSLIQMVAWLAKQQVRGSFRRLAIENSRACGISSARGRWPLSLAAEAYHAHCPSSLIMTSKLPTRADLTDNSVRAGCDQWTMHLQTGWVRGDSMYGRRSRKRCHRTHRGFISLIS